MTHSQYKSPSLVLTTTVICIVCVFLHASPLLAGDLAAANRQLNESIQNDELSQESAKRAKRGSSTTSRIDITLGIAAILVACTAFIFAVAMAIIGKLSFTRFKEAEENLDGVFQKVESTAGNIDKLNLELDRKIMDVRKDLSRQEATAIANQKFFEYVRGEIFDLLVGIVEKIGNAPGQNQEEELKALISEAEACLNLYSPNAHEITQALWRLEKIGSEKCISPLRKLIKDPKAEPDVRVEAQRVLMLVRRQIERKAEQ